jgi:FAD/FMN-containing dehydrogenase
VDTPAPRFQKNATSVTPAWYDSLWHVIYTTTWPNNATVAEQRQDISGVHQAGQMLRDYAPDGGAYINKADVYEPNHEATFWGTANAARLKEIKAKYDPENLFQVWQGIGWSGAADVRYECYSQLNPGSASLVD